MNTTLKPCTFALADVSVFKQKMLNWLKPFGIFCYLDNRQYTFPTQQTECLVAAGVRDFVSGIDLREASSFFTKSDWTFGHLSYELKSPLHRSHSRKEDPIGFPLFYFFRPQVVLEITGNSLVVHADDPATVFNAISQHQPLDAGHPSFSLAPQPLLGREAYIQKVEALRAHILRGDCYEINFCQAFSLEGAELDPFAAFQKLMAISPNPFSAFYRLEDKWLLCASPERFLQRKGGRVISQPIKGTARRNLASPEEDRQLKEALYQSQKEQSENVMVVDLVRNDLTRICREGTVKVDELFGVYSFPQVHQLISTVSGELRDDVSFPDIIEATFPMGSMTGAPKHRVMQLIDEYETGARGIFSGAVGYLRPGGDFDFNVVIRSLMHNQTTQRLSYQVGSGITFYSDAEKEWEECLLKAEAIRKVLA